MNPPAQFCYRIKRGDAFAGDTFRFKSKLGASFWDNFAVKAQFRTSTEGDVVHLFDLSGAAVTEEDGVGILTVSLFVEPTDTATFPTGQIVGDLEVSSDNFPKTTLAFFRATVLADVTR